MESRKLAVQMAIALDKKKAIGIKVISVHDLTVLTDFFVIASGTSTTHAAALADEIEFQIGKNFNLLPNHVEGNDSKRWILLDYGSVIVNVFTPDTREFYSLEHQWADGEEIDISAELKAAGENDIT